MAEGRIHEIRQCIRCNQGCFGALRDPRRPFISCMYNPVAGREFESPITEAPMKKRVVVVGAGPAGCEAARVARLRGHEVIVLEKQDRVGGQFNLAALPPKKGDFGKLVEFYAGELPRLGIDVRLGTAPTTELLKSLKADVYVLATGSTSSRPPIPGADLPHVFMVPEVLWWQAAIDPGHVLSKKRGYGPPVPYTFSWRNVWVAFRGAALALFTPILIVGGIVTGAFTPTESAMIGVFYCLFIALFVYKEMTWAQLPKMLLESAKTTAKLVIIIASAAVFSYISINEGVPEMFEKLMLSVSDNKYVILMLLNVILLLLGCRIDILVGIIIIVPLFLPLGESLGIEPLHMAMIFVMNMSIGLLTPPVGYCLYVSASIAKVPMEKVTRFSVPLVITMIGILVLITFFPTFTTFVPNLFH